MSHAELPAEGMDRATILDTLDAYRQQDIPYRSGRTFAYTYDAGERAEAIGKEVYARFLTENALDPTAFPSLLKLETEVVAIAARHLNADPTQAAGNFTSGGTESILCALKSARDYARQVRGIERPNVVLPVTAHAAFHKAGAYFDLEMRTTAVDDETFEADVDAMREAIDDQTILLVGSSPQYGNGTIDPIEQIAALAQDKGLLCHVDGCVGGWLLPYYERAGADVPPFDFRVPGVTSMSMDWHKYAFCPKGASVVVYRDKDLRRFQIFGCAEWTGYTVINPTVQSSKTGGPLAAAWAVLHHIGDAGYLEIARVTREATEQLKAGIEAIDGLEILGRADFCMVAVKSDEVSVFHVVDEMKERGWTLQAQFSYANSPANIHFSLHPGNAGQVGAMLEDLQDAVDAARKLPSGKLSGMVEQVFAKLTPADLTDEMFERILGMAGIKGVGLPGRMAEINEILDALPRPMTKRLLIEFVNDLYRFRG